jgi:hypothetical protein
MSKPEEIVRWYEQLKNKRTNFDSTAQQIIDYIDPHVSDVSVERAPGARKNERAFDGTSGYGSHVFSQFVQGALFNQATAWFSLRSRDPAVNAKPENAAWLADTTLRMLLALRPNFYGPAGQVVHSWGLFGNGPMLIEEITKPREGGNRFRFTSIPWGKYVMAEGDDGRIDKFIRSLKLPAHEVVKIGDASDDVKKCAEKDPLKEFEVLHSIMPRDFQQTYSKSKTKTNREYDYASCWVEKDKKKLLKESGYRKFPVAVARYDLIAGETYARGLGEVSLADQKTLSMADERAIMKWDRELDPPLLQKRNSIIGGILSTQARGRTVVTDIHNSIKPLNEGSNWVAHDQMAERKQRQILQIWHVQEILNLLAREKPEMTAFEVNARLTLLQQIIGPIFGLLEAEFLSVIVDILLDLMAHIPDMIAEPTDDIAQSSPYGAFDVVYEGPLARAQRNQTITNIREGIADVAGVVGLYPQAQLIVDWEKTLRRVWEIRSIHDLLIDHETFEFNVEQQQQQQQQQKMFEMMGGGAAALGAAAPGIKALGEAAGGGLAEAA